nr:sigma factor [Halalkalibacter okhensis]
MTNQQLDITEWFSQYSDSIFKYILMNVRDHQQAEDLTQETFVKAFKLLRENQIQKPGYLALLIMLWLII